MESLTLPESGRVYLDAQILIYTVEHLQPYCDLLLPLWQASQAGRLDVVTSELTVVEVLTGPLKTGNQDLIDAYEELLTATELQLIPVDLSILKAAASLRASTSLRTPDAIHVATAASAGCAAVITNDLAFGSLRSLNVLILKNILDA